MILFRFLPLFHNASSPVLPRLFFVYSVYRIRNKIESALSKSRIILGIFPHNILLSFISCVTLKQSISDETRHKNFEETPIPKGRIHHGSERNQNV